MLSTVTSHRRFLHQIPEMDGQFTQTLMLITGVLRGHRCAYFSPMPGCVYAWFDFGRTETVAFRAVLDGVGVEEATGLAYSSRHPGCAHAAGNDGGMAMALDLCQWLSERPGDLARNVLVIFQPEAGGGARQVCEAGVLSEYRVSRFFSLRLRHGIPKGTVASRPGALMARSNDVTVRIEGRAAHFSREAEGRDAVLAAAEFLRRVYIMREDVPEPRILRFGKLTAGNSRYTVGAEAILEGCMLTYREEAYEAFRNGLRRIGREVEAETDCVSSVWVGDGFPAVWNDEALWQQVQEALGADAVQELDRPLLEAEDFSFYQKEAPGILFFLGTGQTPELRSPGFDFDDEEILPAGAAFLRKLARLP